MMFGECSHVGRASPARGGAGDSEGGGRGMVLAAVLAGVEPDREDLGQGQGTAAEGCSADNGGAVGGDRGGTAGHHGRGLPEFVRPLWISRYTRMRNALTVAYRGPSNNHSQS